MNLLFLTPLVPYPPQDGDKLTAYRFLEGLARRGHRVDLFCLTRQAPDLRHLRALRPLCRRVHGEVLSRWELFLNLMGALPAGRPPNVAAYFSPRFRAAVEAYFRSPDAADLDAVFAHRLRMHPYAFGDNPGRPVVLDFADCLSNYARLVRDLRGAPLQRRLLSAWDAAVLPAEEARAARAAARALVSSERERVTLSALGVPLQNLVVVENGVERGPDRTRSPYSAGEGPVLCFMGNMGYFPNEDGALWFHREVWPKVRQRRPQARLYLVGGTPGRRLRRLAEDPSVSITGWVPRVEPYLDHAAASLIPLRIAVGFQNKVALSLARGVPTAATEGALGWMPPEVRRGYPGARDAGELAAILEEILADPAAARARARAVGRRLRARYTWVKSVRKVERELRQAVRDNPREALRKGGEHEGQGNPSRI